MKITLLAILALATTTLALVPPEPEKRRPRAFEAVIEPIAGYAGDMITGHVVIFQLDASELLLKSSIDGLQGVDCSASGSACGHHIHSGTACDDSTTQGGHLLLTDCDADCTSDSCPCDPWYGMGINDLTNTTGMQDVWNAPTIELDATYPEYADIDGKPFVVHDGSGNRAACGMIIEVPISLHMAMMEPIPGTNSLSAVTGTVLVLSSPTGMAVGGRLSGAFGTFPVPQRDGAGGLHVHSGWACTNSTTQGGHYYAGADYAGGAPLPVGTAADPWNSHTYLAVGEDDDLVLDGTTEHGFMFPVLTGTDYSDVAFKPFVFHDETGGRASCGVLMPIDKLNNM